MCRLYNRLTAKTPDLWKKSLHSGTSTLGIFCPRPTLCSFVACPLCGREWARTLWGPSGDQMAGVEGNCVPATLAGLGFGLAVGPFWSQWRLVCLHVNPTTCHYKLCMWLWFVDVSWRIRVPSWVLGCLKNWNQKVISFASTVLCACRYVPHVLGLYVPHFACI